MSDATHEMPQQTWKFLTLGRAGVLAKILKRLRVRLQVCAAPIDVGEGELSLRCVLRSVKLVGKDRRIVPGTRGRGTLTRLLCVAKNARARVNGNQKNETPRVLLAKARECE